MPQKTLIKDPSTGLIAEVVNHDEKNGLVVATRKLKSYTNSLRFFTSDEYGADLNQDASAGGTPEKVHDGTDSILWTATDIVGSGDTEFDSDDQNHTTGGTMSIKVNDTDVDDVFQLVKGSDLDCSMYTSISMWVYVDKDWKAGDSIELYGWDTDTNTIVGTPVKLESYFNFLNYDVWQKIVIPTSDMGSLVDSTTLDAIRFRQVTDEGKAPKYYLDDIQFEESGTPVRYSLQADKDTWLHVDSFQFTLAAPLDTTLADATMPNLSYDKLLVTTLTSGINYQRTKEEETLFSITLSKLFDFLQLPEAKIVNQGYDGTNAWITISVKHVEPLVLKNEEDDSIDFTISEDLSSFVHLRIMAGCRIEDRADKRTNN